MKKTSSFITVILLFLFTQCNRDINIRDAYVWQMESNLCVIELENANYSPLTEGYWEVVNESDNRGNNSITWKGKNNIYSGNLAYDAPLTNMPNKLIYEVKINNEGDYHIYIRSMHNADSGNSVWLSVNKKSYVNVIDSLIDWSWASPTANNNLFHLHEGINNIEIVGREKGIVLDKMVIVNKNTAKEDWQNSELSESTVHKSEKLDRKSPSTPQDLKAKNISMSSAVLGWDECTDNEEVYCYHIYSESSGWIDISFKNEYLITGLKPSTEYNFFIVCTDLSGNSSDDSEKLKITTEGFDPETGTEITKLRIPPTIDGDIDGLWDEIAYQEISTINKGEIINNKDLSAKFKIAWDESYMYFLFNIDDDTIITNELCTEGIEIYLDMDNSKSDYQSINDRIYRFYLNKPKNNGTFYEYTELINNKVSLKGIREERKIKSNGYTIECAFPWSALGIIPSVDEYIGFDIKVIDCDNKENPTIITWYGEGENALTSPYFYGTGELQGNLIF